MMFSVKFWGVRGSIPAPITSSDVKLRLAKMIKSYRDKHGEFDPDDFLKYDFQRENFTHGGNTPCVEIMINGRRIILDMGSGLRPLGDSLIKDMLVRKGLDITFLLSHVHSDHIHGLPFFSPLYANKETGIKNIWTFYGGTDWKKSAEACIREQMESPHFPKSWQEIEKMTYEINFHNVYDRFSVEIEDGITAICRKLNHPDETYGWRVQDKDGRVVAYTTDNEPFDPHHPDPALIHLVFGADLWIADCQFSKDVYHGKKGGVNRYGWGHSYPEAVAVTAKMAKPKKIALFHHDPGADYDAIMSLRNQTAKLLHGTNIMVLASSEGLIINI